MPDSLLHLARDGKELGAFTLEEVRELAETGFLQPTDEVWFRGLNGWRPLEEVLGEAMSPHGDWRDKLIAGTTALSGVVGRRLGQMVGGVKARAAQGQDALAQARTVALEQFLPQFQKRAAEYLRDKPATLARNALASEELARKVFAALYDCLPRPVCRFVSETDFIAFCLEHRQRLLGGAAPDEPGTPAGTPGDSSPDAPRA